MIVSAPRLVCVVPNPSVDKVGEVERVETGAIHRPSDLVTVPGGKGLNVARAADRLGVPVAAVVLLAGHAGRWIDDALSRSGLAHGVVWAGSGETRSCLSVLDRSTGRLTEFYEPGPRIAAITWRAFRRLIRDAVSATDPDALVAVSGSLPPGVDHGGLADLVRDAGRGGRRVLVDASGPTLAAALPERPFLVKVNADEAASFAGGPIASEAAAVAAATEIVRHGASAAIVTRGDAGAVLVDETGAWAVGSVPGGPYVVGSGDAFLAGLASGLVRGRPLHDALRRAAAAGAASTLVAGQGEIRPADVRRLEVLVRVSRVATTGPSTATAGTR